MSKSRCFIFYEQSNGAFEFTGELHVAEWHPSKTGLENSTLYSSIKSVCPLMFKKYVYFPIIKED